MEKCLVINRIPLGEESKLRRKHYEQVKAFINMGYDTYYIGYDGKGCYLINRNERIFICKSGLHGYKTYRALYKAALFACRKYGPFKFAYMRMVPTTPSLISFLKATRKYVDKLIYEFPTFPYDKELVNNSIIMSKGLHCLDLMCRRSLKKYIDVAATFSYDSSIYGIPAVHIENGIIVEDYPVHKNCNQDINTIRMIMVAKVNKFHGFDRMIEGLKQYYEKPNTDKKRVYIELCGTGSELEKLKSLVSQYRLEEYIAFNGTVVGDDLDVVFDRVNIGIDALASHRKGLTVSSTLKSREYMARGLPFIYADNIDGISDKEWCLKFEPNETPIDINRVVSWYDNLSQNRELESVIREYALQNLSWSEQFKKVL